MVGHSTLTTWSNPLAPPPPLGNFSQDRGGWVARSPLISTLLLMTGTLLQIMSAQTHTYQQQSAYRLNTRLGHQTPWTWGEGKSVGTVRLVGLISSTVISSMTISTMDISSVQYYSKVLQYSTVVGNPACIQGLEVSPCSNGRSNGRSTASQYYSNCTVLQCTVYVHCTVCIVYSEM